MTSSGPPKYYHDVLLCDESVTIEHAIPPLDIPKTPTKTCGTGDILHRLSTKWDDEDNQVYRQYQKDKKQCVDKYMQQYVTMQEHLRREMVEVDRQYLQVQNNLRLQRKCNIQHTLDQGSSYSTPAWYQQVRQWWAW